MRHAPILAALVAGLVPAAYAADSSRVEDPKPFEWTEKQFAFVAGGDAKLGKKLAKQARCKRCHNVDGISDDEETPSIAGQRATYMYKQMMDFKNGFRENREMYKVVRRLAEEEMVHISAYYADMERPEKVGGDAMLQVKVCDSCHNKDIVEKDDHIEVAPILTGQIRQYLENTMLAFREADRSNDLFDRMQSVSHKLTVDEIRRLARYYGAPDITDE